MEVTLTGFFEFLLVAVALLAGFSILWDRLSVRRAARAVRRAAVRCRICGAVYRRESGHSVEACPECGAENPCGRDRRLG